MAYVCISNKFNFRSKMMGIDFDHTIVKPKYGKTFPKDKDDWEWLRPNIPEIIKSYYEKGYAIVIFTNQFKEFKKIQVKNVLDKLGCPYLAYLAYDKKIKKPSPHLFELYRIKYTDTDNVIDFKNSFYVGDAMGRQHDWSDSDKLFANNCGIQAKTPEEIFPFEENAIIDNIHENVFPVDYQELIIMVGFPGSGKTTITKIFDNNNNYAILHGDELKTESKMKRHLKLCLTNGKSVILDATHPSKKKRNVFISIAKQFDVPVKVIHLTTDMKESMYRNSIREKPVPRIVFYIYNKNFENPDLSEGISEIIKI